ncbi:hypothetical protein TCON_2452 [Astathelohania contejeani]|uniref:Uncharacterized protein n=1 Tax=Astathelohania contejeani TaxID=164912 RepID=A0ABQ7HW06_9MICR|nr:hypothetical protein TCON_2452 [Thelohania contejeani]
MRKLNLTFEKPHDLTEAIVSLKESIQIYSKKLEMYAKRKERRHENQCFELYRGRFYWRLSEEAQMVHGVDVEKIKEYWSTMWVKPNVTNENCLVEYLPESEYITTFPTFTEFEDIIKHLANWKAAGVDGIFNFFIMHISSVHKHLYEIIKDICLEGKTQDEWFYRGITYLIPKNTPSKGSDFRPITCMSNLYKLTTKCVTKVMHIEVGRRGLLAENQLGTIKRVQGAK